MVIDQLFIQLGIDPRGVRSGIQSAETAIANGVKSMLSILAPLAGVATFVTMAETFTQSATQINKSAELLGLSIEEMQAWQGAATAMGAEGEEINEMLIDMNEYLVDMVQFGSGPAVDVLNKLGISATDAAGNIRPATDVLLEMAAAGEKISKQEMLAYGKIMGFDKSIIDLLMQGRKGLEDLLKAQMELAVYNKEDVAIAKEANLAKQTLYKNLEAVNAVIMRAAMPAVTAFTNALTKGVLFLRQNEGIVKAFFVTLGVIVGALGIKMLIAFAPMILIFGAIAGALTGVILLVDDFFAFLEGGESALAPLWNAVIGFFSYFETSIEGIKNLFFGLLDIIVGIFTLNFSKIGDGIITILKGTVQVIAGVFEALVSMIWDMFTGLFSWIGDGISSAWDGITSFFSGDDDAEENKNKPKSPSKPTNLSNMASPYNPNAIYNSTANANSQTNNTNNISNSTNLGAVNIYTQATDANGIAKNINPAIQNEMSHNNLVMAGNTGVVAK